ncbi:phosphonate C-P lyase system protein PhnH [Segnochrobactrum spirostomi]|uniref:Phosphonate C-P lyase system protein PhnH n=1 Tax=Segnochrobactrum spirostomi TaxID=2608987 RepID=A0A6A7Y187_9HYPH|nr:phosphonate C-P lyase system protein PhnH [Segnochrobactrum spirostomi]MQT12820.1 phosphonate C-P lyase system protein PhnH [Segnochrobactrum spirostomi]
MLAPGFDDPGLAAQAVFRAVMDAMARPGRIGRIAVPLSPPAPLGTAMAAVALALTDFETPLWLDPTLAGDDGVRRWLAFHTGAPVVAAPAEAAFALVTHTADLPRLAAFAQGTDDYPDRSTTLILAVDALADDTGATLSGPGIDGETRLSVPPLGAAFWRECRLNHAGFPRGVDVLFTAGERIAALPRSTRIAVEAGEI